MNAREAVARAFNEWRALAAMSPAEHMTPEQIAALGDTYGEIMADTLDERLAAHGLALDVVAITVGGQRG